MKICRKNYHGYKQVSDDYNLIDVNKYSNKELLEDNLIITKAMTIEKCKSKEELKINLLLCVVWIVVCLISYFPLAC